MVWLKIRKHDIVESSNEVFLEVVVWLKIRKHDILLTQQILYNMVVVWLKIRKHDIQAQWVNMEALLWFD